MKNPTESILPVNGGRGLYNAREEREAGILARQLKLAREAKGLSVKELQRRLALRGVEVGYTTLFRWEKGETEPTAYQLLALCDALGLAELCAYFTRRGGAGQLNEEGLRKLREYRADLIATGKYKPAPRARAPIRYVEMPVSTLGASAGTGEFLSGENIELMRFPESGVPAKADFAIRVVGDSMEPLYQDHQLVWVQSCNSLRPGEVGIFVLDGEGYIKAYEEREPSAEQREDFTDSSGVLHKQAVLVSYNEKYAPRVVAPGSKLKICGRVLRG